MIVAETRENQAAQVDDRFAEALLFGIAPKRREKHTHLFHYKLMSNLVG